MSREIFELAGAVGVDPRPFSWRKLWWMYIGRAKLDYGIAAGVRIDVRRSGFQTWGHSDLQWSAVDPTYTETDTGGGFDLFTAMGMI